MPSIYSYQKVTDEFTTYRLNEPRDENGNSLATELATVNGTTYVAIEDGAALPPQPPEITVEPVTMTDDLAAAIRAASPHAKLINQRVVDLIRQRYSVDDELKLLRLAPSPESDEYNTYVEECRAWGRGEKEKLGL